MVHYSIKYDTETYKFTIFVKYSLALRSGGTVAHEIYIDARLLLVENFSQYPPILE